MASKKEKRAKARKTSTAQDKANRLRTQHNKVEKLRRVVNKNPNDDTAAVALWQAEYDLRLGRY